MEMGKIGIKFDLHNDLHIRDPQDTDYGQKLIGNAIILMDKVGFEQFNFKKLASAMDSNETSIYRYFENKHKLLLWIECWYWEWVNYLIDINLRNIEDSEKKLKIVIHNIVNASTESPLTSYINENILHKVIIKEGSKAYHFCDVDKENKSGFFSSYKFLVDRVSKIIKEVDPKFEYPRMLSSNLFEMANNQIYFAEHMPALTEIKNNKNKYDQLEHALVLFVDRLLDK